MNGRKAKERRRAYDPRQYQVILQATIEWNRVDAGICWECHTTVQSPQRRSRVSAYDSGYLSQRRPLPGETAAAHGDRAMREMNARQREGDFSLVAPPRLLCLLCAKKAAYRMAQIDGWDDGNTRYADALLAFLQPGLRQDRHDHWTAFCQIAEPGDEGHMRMVCPTGTGNYKPASVLKTLRHNVEIDGYRVREPVGMFVDWTLRIEAS